MALKYFPTLLRSVAVSLLVLGVGMIDEGPLKWAAVAAALLPLIYYHLGFLSPRIKGVGDIAAIDSVYYFGFLLTVAALAFSAISLGNTSEIALQPVLLKFGVGLAATAYAVLARMHLLSRISNAEVTSLNDVAENYLRRSQALIDDVDTAISRVKAFSETVLSESLALHTKTKSEFDQHLLGSAQAFRNELNHASSAAREAIAGIGELVNDVAFVAERSELNRLIQETASTSRRLTDHLDGFDTQINASAQNALLAAAAISALGKSIQDLDTSITGIGGPEGAIAATTRSLTATADASVSATQSARDALAVTVDLTQKLGANDQAFAALLSFAKTVSTNFEALASTAASLDAALVQISKATATADTISTKLAVAGSAFPSLGDEAEALTKRLGELKNSVGTSAQELEADVQRSAQASRMLIETLTSIAEQIIQRTRAQQGLP